jgi:hypothetical protein
MASGAAAADTSGMTCIQCGMTIWDCACCETSCSAPVCERCAAAGDARHERITVTLPQLSADASYATW